MVIKTFLDQNNSLIERLTLHQDNSFNLNNELNKKILGDTYFKQPANIAGLGKNGNADYTNYYGTSYIRDIIAQHIKYSHPDSKMVIDMKGLGLSETLIEQNLDFGSISPNIKRFKYYDKSDIDKPLYFDEPQLSPITQSHDTKIETSIPIISPKHQKFVQQCEDKLVALCNEKGITADSPQDFKNVAAALVAKGIAEKGMTKVDKMVMNGLSASMLSYEPHGKLVSANINEMVNIPVHESFAKIQQSEQQMAQQAQERQMAQQQKSQGHKIV